MVSRRSRIFALTLLSVNAAMVYSDEKEDIGKITVEDESEVIDLSRSPMPISVIDASRFHGRNISLNEVLKRVAGVKVSQQGGLGSKSTIAIHGLEGKRVKIFIDGSPLNSPDGSFGINDIPIQLIERIEIYKGVVPAKFGGDSLGGAVNVVTRSFDGSWVDLNLSLGSHNTQRFAGVLNKRFEEEKIEIGIGGFYNYASNDYEMDSPFVEGLKIERDHDMFTSKVAAFVVTVEDRWFDEISMELVRYDSEKEIQGVRTNIREAKNKSVASIIGLDFEKNDFLIDGLNFEYGLAKIGLTTNYIDKATTCFNFDGSEKNCPGAGGEISGIPHDSSDRQDDLRHDLNLRYGFNRNHALNIHVNSQYSKYKPSDDLANAELGYDIGAFPSDRTTTISSLGYESAFLNDKLVNDMGIKNYSYDYTVTAQERSLTGLPERTNSDGSEVGFYESIRYSPVTDLYLKASFEHAYRLPDSNEIFGDGMSITSAPNLKPEKANNYNLGVQFDSFDVAGMPWVKAEANVFYRDLGDMIKLVPGLRTSGYQNLDEVSVKGFEVEVKADITDNWYLYANFTNQTLRDEKKFLAGTASTPNPTYGLDVPNVANRFGNIGAEFKTLGLFRDDSLLKIFWETSWADDYYYGWELSKNQSRKIDAQLSHTTGFEYSFLDDEVIVGFEIRNVTDEKISDVFNYPLMGRTYHLNFRYSWFN